MQEDRSSLIKHLIRKHKLNMQNIECQHLSQFIEDLRPDLAEKLTTKDILEIIEEEKNRSTASKNCQIEQKHLRADDSYENKNDNKIINNYSWPNGNKYLGEWKDGKMDGFGEYTWVSGITYKGGFKNGKLHGQGLWYMADLEVPLFNGMAIDAKYALLFLTLIFDGTTTKEEVEEMNILKYLNTKNLYDYKNRMKIVSEINEIFNIKKRNDVDKQNNNNDYVKETTENQYMQKLGDNDHTKEKVEAYLKLQQCATSFEEIKSVMHRSKIISLRSIVDVSNSIVNVKGKYIHRANICGFDHFAEVILSTLETQFFINSGHTTASLLYAAVQNRLEDFFFDNGFESASEVYALTQHLFSKEKYKDKCFIFARSFHIWEQEPDYPKTYAGLFIKWARENNGLISKTLCHEKLSYIGASSIDALFTNTYYKIKDLLWQFEPYKFVLAECLDIDDQWKDELSESLLALFNEAAFIPLRDIEEHWFETLPSLPISVNWSPLLLQEVIIYLDVGFKTIPAGYGQSFDVIHAAIVPEKSSIETFGDVVWTVIDEEYGTPTNVIVTEELRQILIKRNILHGNERLWSLHKAIGNDLRFRWNENYSRVKVFNL